MRRLSESIWSDIQDRSSGEVTRKEDIKPQDYECWWRNIPLDNAPKYKKEELRLSDFIYDRVIWKVERTMNIMTPNTIRIYFKNEGAWHLSIYHNTAHGADNYTMEANGTRHYSPSKYSEMLLPEKRGIRYRLESKTFYVYKNGSGEFAEYVLTEKPEMNGKKGVLLK